ncbi:hypothetical protein Tco_0422986 [Tanacetum coccineum]
MRLMLAPRSANALPGSPSFFGNLLRMTAEQFSFKGVLASSLNRRLDVFGASVISKRHRVLCHLDVMINCFRSLDGNTTSGSDAF